MHKILITGSNGLLGQKIVKRCLKHNIPFLATSKGENRNPDCPNAFYRALDITDAEAVNGLVQDYCPTAIIHTAAMTNVDQCETDPEGCYMNNVLATRYLFEAAKFCKAHFELVSTDFVFDGKAGPYSESDPVNPLSVYARSKVEAENLLLHDTYSDWSIARTIIVYGTGKGLSRSNMVLWALEALPKNQVMKLVNDQFRAPTWADDLAYGCVEIVLRNETGIYHLSGPETMSVDNIVRRIAQTIGVSNPNITVISSDTLNQAAKRPPRTGFVLDKAQQKLDYHPQKLEETIPLLINELQS